MNILAILYISVARSLFSLLNVSESSLTVIQSRFDFISFLLIE